MKSVLIIDDSFTLRRSLRVCFEKEGFEVFEAGTGAEGFDFVKGFKGKLQFIIADQNMPEMSGMDMVEGIRKLEDQDKAKVIIVLVTSDISVETRKRAIDNDVRAIVYKPIKPQALVRALIKAL